MQTLPYMGLLITNTLITLFSFGFAVPVAEVRHAVIWRVYVGRSDLALLDIAAHQGNRQQRGGRRSGAGAGSGRQFLRRQ